MKEINIAFITPRISGIGGAEKYVAEKILWLKKNNYSCIVIAGNHEEGESPYLELLKENKIKYYNIDWLNNPAYIIDKNELEKKLKELKKIIDENNIDIIESNQIICGIYGYNLSIKYKIPILLNVLSELGFEKKTDYIELLKRFNKKNLYYNLGSNSNRYIENETGEKLENCRNIPIPITWNDTIEIKDKEFILTVARFDRGKEYLFSLIEDFRKLKLSKEEIIPKKLILVGDGIYKGKIEKRVSEINEEFLEEIIVLKGFVTGIELEKLYSECSIYVGMGTTLLTAAAYKKPCIIATIDEKNNYKSIGYFKKEKNNEYSFGQPLQNSEFQTYDYYILKLCQDKLFKINIVENSYGFIEEYFSLESVMRRWEREYSRILSDFNSLGNEYYIPRYKFFIYLKIYLKRYKIIQKILRFKTKK
ncbi:glycosyltransferase [uncultured Cetobacterium sp.]|uniref:glycosyltransferase n=1 Tax=uncultured Cetobacterium sp. TaxID=527638 RepID=UPI00262A2AEF|nr:glycosyltransferase [uncultured Cetobacterium sp.]